ncbi:MAG: portal protein [Bellilinea sp.]
MNSKELRQLADNVFSKRASLLSLWQEQAENFYPERADFTFKRYLGDDFAANLMTSYPVLVSRDLGDQISTMLRNTAKPWFNMTTNDARKDNDDSKRWLEWATGLQRRAMYDPNSMFNRATKECDRDFSTFGQGVIQVRMNRKADGLLYKCHHLRDVAWMENEDGKICAIFRRWKPQARIVKQLFDKKGGSVHPSLTKMADKEPFAEVDCLHIMIEADMFDGADERLPWRSIYYDCKHDHEMESVAVKQKEYVIPRWQTVSGSQYSYSPATIAALPEARLLQSMTYTLLEAGEKLVNPAMIATEQAIRSDMSLYAGGVTWVDYEYDERLGAALRPITTDAKGMPLSQDMMRDSRALLSQCFYLNKLMLPQRAPEMTAYEVGQRVQEYVRGAMPLFEPMEADYNGGICEETFALLLNNNAFGPLRDIPKSLRGADIQFRFQSPLHDAIEMQKGHKFLEMKQLIAEAIALDQSVAAIPDSTVAIRDALEGIGVPMRWVRKEAEVAQMIEAEKKAQNTQALLANMQAGADVAAKLGEAQQSLGQTA